jgi:hypothetical protein
VERQPSFLTGRLVRLSISCSTSQAYDQGGRTSKFYGCCPAVMKHLLTICRVFGLCLLLNILTCGQTLPSGSAFTLNDAGTQLRLGQRVLLDAQQDGFMSIKEVLPAPDQTHFAVVACGYECNDNIGFLFRADGGGKRKFTARWDAILQTVIEWSADGRQLNYYRINSSGAVAPRRAPRPGWVSVDVRTGIKTAALARRLKNNARYAVFNVRNDDVLNVRARADVKAPILGTLTHAAKGVRITGAAVLSGGSVWVPIQAQGLSGWVKQNYLREERTQTTTN